MRRVSKCFIASSVFLFCSIVRCSEESLVLSLNLTDGGTGFPCSDEQKAGVVEVGYWETFCGNSAMSDSNALNLRDSNGEETAVSYKWSGDNAGSYSGVTGNYSALTAKMLENWTAAHNCEMRFAALSNFSARYDVYVYFMDIPTKRRGSISVKDQSYFVETGESKLSRLNRAESKSAIAASKVASLANYVKFENVDDDILVIKFKSSDHSLALPVNGIQIVARPESLKEISIRNGNFSYINGDLSYSGWKSSSRHFREEWGNSTLGDEGQVAYTDKNVEGLDYTIKAGDQFSLSLDVLRYKLNLKLFYWEEGQRKVIAQNEFSVGDDVLLKCDIKPDDLAVGKKLGIEVESTQGFCQFDKIELFVTSLPVNCNPVIKHIDDVFEWTVSSESGIKEFKIVNAKTQQTIVQVEALEADVYSITLDSKVKAELRAVTDLGDEFILK